MDRFIGFVDVGFLHAEGAKTLGGHQWAYRLAAKGVVHWMRGLGAASSPVQSFVRSYWYDGEFDVKDPAHGDQRRFFDALRHTPGVHLRLGRVVRREQRLRAPVTAALRSTADTLGVDPPVMLHAFQQHWEWRPRLEQKGVDVLIALDLVRLAQRRAFGTALLVSGDGDLYEAVRTVQDEGLRVVVAHPTGGGVAPELKQLADEVVEMDAQALRGMLQAREYEAATATGDGRRDGARAR